MKKTLKKVPILLFLMICGLVFFAPIHVLAYEDSGNYEIKPTAEEANWLVWWNWSHNDMRDPIMNELASIKNSGVTANVNTQEIKNSIDVAGEIETFYEEKEKEGSTEIQETPIKLLNTKVKLANELWFIVGKALESGGDLGAASVNKSKDGLTQYMSLGVSLTNIQTDPIYSAIINTLKLAAYSIVLLFFSINLIETTVKYEIVSFRGFVSVFGRMVFSKIIIDSAALICTKILGVIKWIAAGTLNSVNVATNNALAVNISSSESKLWVIGKIVDFFHTIMNAIPMMIMSLIVIIVSLLILGKLMIRSIQLVMMTVVSPLFFACASADVTKQYFKNFITAFLQCGLQIVFMVIIYGVGIRVLNNNEINGSGFMSYGVSTMNTYRSILVYIIMGILIVKPPKFLTNAIN